MDVRQYYRKIREVEADLHETYPLVISLETSDGGKAGLVTEVSRELAAKMIVEGRVMVADERERELYRQQQVIKKRASDKAELARRVQVAIITDPDLQSQISGKKAVDPSEGEK